MEDLIQIDNFKYTLCKVNYLNDVFDLCAKFQINSPLKDVKVNLHPKSCKVWKPLEDFWLALMLYILYQNGVAISHNNTTREC
jgi:hypothetical protein